MYKNLTQPKKSTHLGRWIILGIFLLAILVAVLELTNVTHIFHKVSKPVTASSYTKGETGLLQNDQRTNPQNSTNNSNTSTAQPGDQKSATGGSTTTNLLTPTGDFVSNHHPNLSGSPAPNSINSVCTTTPGASCTITFTKDGVTKSLPSQVTDRGGSAYWSWKLQDLGLTAGSWNIEAHASLDEKSTVASDAMQLVVAQ